MRDRIRQRAQEVCDANGVSIEHVNKSHIPHIRKEDRVARVLAVRGDAPGLVHVLSAMESCLSYKPWLDKRAATSAIWRSCPAWTTPVLVNAICSGSSQPRVGADPSVKGLNFFGAGDQTLLRTLQHGEFTFTAGAEPNSWLG